MESNAEKKARLESELAELNKQEDLMMEFTNTVEGFRKENNISKSDFKALLMEYMGIKEKPKRVRKDKFYLAPCDFIYKVRDPKNGYKFIEFEAKNGEVTAGANVAVTGWGKAIVALGHKLKDLEITEEEAMKRIPKHSLGIYSEPS